MNKKTLIILYSMGIVCLFYIAQKLQYKKQDQSYILCTTTIIADTVRNITGDCIAVKSLMQEDIDPHTYTPTAQDLHTILDAQLIFYNGLHLEARMIDVLEQLHKTIPTYAVSKDIQKINLIVSPDNPDYPDPHIWFDISLWKQVVHTIYTLVCTHYPEHADMFKNNYTEYVQRLEQTDEYIQSLFAPIAQNKRFLVTAHDAFSYFAQRYHFSVISLQGISTQTEAGMSDILHIVHTIVHHKIPTIFIEHSISSKNIEALQEAVQEKGHHVHIGHTLYSDALGGLTSSGNTYIAMIKHNAGAIAHGLLQEKATA